MADTNYIQLWAKTSQLKWASYYMRGTCVPTTGYADSATESQRSTSKFMAANSTLLPFTCPMPATQMNCWRPHTTSSGQPSRRPVVHSCGPLSVATSIRHPVLDA